MTFREATDLLGLPLERIAEETGREYSTIVAYRAGKRSAPKAVMIAIAKLARERAGELEKLAQALEAKP